MKWYNRFITFEGKGTNLPDVVGSLLLLLSLLLPWVRVPYRLTVQPVSGAELALALCFRKEYYSLWLTLCVIYIVVLALYTLLSGTASRAAPMATAGAVILAVSVFLLPLPLLLPGFGIFCAGAGLLSLIAGFFVKRV